MKKPWISMALPIGAAVIGCFLTPPLDAYEISFIREFDAIVCCLLSIVVWGLFHLLGLQRYDGARAAAVITISALFWMLLVGGVMQTCNRFHQNEEDYEEMFRTLTVANSTESTPSRASL